MPSDDCLRPHDAERASPVWPESMEKDPEEPVSVAKGRAFLAAAEDFKLVAERDIFKKERLSRSKCGCKLGVE